MPSFIDIVQRKRNDLSELEVFAGVCERALSQATKAVESIDLQHRIATALNEPPPYESVSELEQAKARAQKKLHNLLKHRMQMALHTFLAYALYGYGH
ncbi:hypothetical protein NAV28_05945 [Pseudomonas stutzeri]|nr:hypothetical protein [Stutzerimonas degradans]